MLSVKSTYNLPLQQNKWRKKIKQFQATKTSPTKSCFIIFLDPLTTAIIIFATYDTIKVLSKKQSNFICTLNRNCGEQFL